MKITKLDPFTLDDPRPKHRTTSNSQQKQLSSLVKKKIQTNITNLQPQQIQRPTGFHEQQGQYPQGEEYPNGGSQPLTHSKKPITGEILYKDSKESFMDFLEAQMKNQQQQQPNKNKIKLPLISSTKQTTNMNSITEDDFPISSQTQQTYKLSSTKNNTQTQEIPRSSTKQNPIFINIKAVTPIDKATVTKKKDHSLRDLRILRKERQNQDDHIVQNERGENNQNSRGKVNALMGKKSYLKASLKEDSPSLKLATGEKKRSNRSSLQKISSAVNARQKRTFSINQSKKKYATNYQDICVFISSLNKLRITSAPIVLYKAFVGKGNNSILVKNAIKNRFWWNIVPEKTNNQEVNFVWGQQRDAEYVNDLAKCSKGKGFMSDKSIDAVKKLKYHLQAKQQQKQQPIRQFTRYGFARLLSQKQLKDSGSTPLYAQTIAPQSFPQPLDPQKLRIHNHLQYNWNLTNKKALFYNLKTYYELIKDDPFKYIPLTFHVKEVGDAAWEEFKDVFEERLKQKEEGSGNAGKDLTNTKEQGKKKKKDKKEKGNNPLWIIKPGQNSNQGCGIQVSDSLQQIVQIVKQKTQTGKNRSSIIQRYLMPFLYNKRKFDIRCYMLATSIKGQLRGYWYQEGYIRTSSKEFTTKNLKNRMIHLTNDAVQKKGQDYGKYENGNKISFADFQKYLDNNFSDKKLSFYKTVYPKMMRLARDALTATHHVLDANNREFTFEVFGLDFMIDEEFQTWLIQVNNNPCLQLSSPLLARIIPNMIENAFKVAIDPLFPPPLNIPKIKNLQTDLFESNKFTLIFSSGDIEQGFQHSISQNKVNLDKIIQGEEDDDELMDDEDDLPETNGDTGNQGVEKKQQVNEDSSTVMAESQL